MSVTLAAFDGAIDPATASLPRFPALGGARSPRSGGRRASPAGWPCSARRHPLVRATAISSSKGFGVQPVEGGILRYLEEVPESQSRLAGRRVSSLTQARALNHRLEPAATAFAMPGGCPLAGRSPAAQLRGRWSCHTASANSTNADCARFRRAANAKISLGAPAGGRNHIAFLQLGRWIPSQSSSVKLALLCDSRLDDIPWHA